jgi:Cu/Ag efflux protein CusF
MKPLTVLVFVVTLSAPALAQDKGHSGHAAHGAAASTGVMADGEVRRVDKDAQKITIRHGPLPQLDMPQPMTMVYQVKDPALLERVKPGDKVKFEAEKTGGAFRLVRIELANPAAR